MSEGVRITGWDTWVAKVAFPLFWFGGWGAALLYGKLTHSAGMSPEMAKAVLCVGAGGVGAFSLWLARQLKVIELHGDELEVCGFVAYARVPLREVTAMDTIRWINFNGCEPVRLRTTRPMPFANPILFLPDSDAVLAELRAAWERSREGAFSDADANDSSAAGRAVVSRHARVKLKEFPRCRVGQ